MCSFLYYETRTVEPPPARRPPGSLRYLYKADAATPLAWDGSGPKRQGKVLPEDMRFGGPFESSLAEFAPSQFRTRPHQAIDEWKSRRISWENLHCCSLTSVSRVARKMTNPSSNNFVIHSDQSRGLELYGSAKKYRRFPGYMMTLLWRCESLLARIFFIQYQERRIRERN